MDCIFCKIVEGEIGAQKIYEDDDVLAFLDISPVNKGHTLVIPKEHSKNLLEADTVACMDAVKKIAPAVMEAMGADGFNLGSNVNSAAGQAVFHTHFHIIPRFKDDGLRHWPQKSYDDDMEQVAEKIRDKL